MQRVEENNKLIAEFMDLKQVLCPTGIKSELLWVHKDFKEDFTHINDLSFESPFDWENFFPQTNNLFYNSSWDWLMPVLIKIETLGYSWKLEVYVGIRATPQYRCSVEGMYGICGISAIDAVWGAIVEFIKWYNSKKD